MHAEGQPAAASGAASPREGGGAAAEARVPWLATATWPFGALVALSLGALALVYAVALGTVRGLSFDATAVTRIDPATRPGAYQATSELLNTISVESLALLGGGIIAVALVRGRAAQALAAATVLLGANVTTKVLKPVLGALDPLGGEAVRALPASFPSGHATVAMSIGLALVLVVPPAARLLAAALGAGYAAAIGVALLALSFHYPSDVVGGYLVATAWAAAAAGALRLWGAHRARRPLTASRWGPRRLNTRTLALAAAALVVAFLVAAMLAVLAQPGLLYKAAVHTRFFFAAFVIAGLSAAIFAAAALLLHRYPARPGAA